MKKEILFVFCLLAVIINHSVLAQDQPQPTESKMLPFAISEQKRLSEEDLKNKKEGVYVTGVPELSSDPINGFGYGAEGSLYFNGSRKDSFFYYTPYRGKLDVVLFNTTRNQREIGLKLDVPYIFNTKWRLRVTAAYEINPNLLYFGINENSLNSLSYYPQNDSSRSPVTDASYKNYSNNLDYTRNGYTNHYYNGYTKEEYILNISGERSYLEGRLRLLAGFEIAQVNIKTFDNRKYKQAIDPVNGNTVTAQNASTLLTQDYNSGKITGLGNNLVDILQVGIIYDTRDLEPDPSKGIFAEITNEFSNKAIGSAFNFNKTFAQIKYYKKLLPSVFGKMIFAGRFGIGYTAGNAPFYEYQDQWSSEGSIEGLGGPNTLRGYKQSRFLARTMDFLNLELRTRFAQTTIAKQHLAFSAVPFFDAGGVWNSLSRLDKFKNYRTSEGLGLRIAWNVNTILRFDYAVSEEDHQFFFNFNHAF